MSEDIKQFIRENEVLFWGVKPDEKENIILNVLVEAVDQAMKFIVANISVGFECYE